ncbi:hypothetical protein K8B83_09315 [Shewanella inventionis]|uniref:hypothetical protein n=1 Tax=Shewanella inventionis TaxID=1738770 RepID=UPI001CC15723|nr:hypothetical protein [Shewanella inventionis]UAL44980.1 hypothetical protein K8B83_09315 [Shewanella inventionis]
MDTLQATNTTFCLNKLTSVFTALLLSVSAQVMANDEVTPQKANSSNKPVVIESQVTGSQEQPKVLYIMPWQGITSPIDINNKDMRLTLPEFKPINPKAFKQQVRDFANSSQTTEK